MKKFGAVLAATFLMGTAIFALASCGDGNGGEAAGGSITVARTSQPEALDPALSYTVDDWQSMWLVYTPLLTYRHEEGQAGSELIPGLAEAMPEVSKDGRTYELTLRNGLRYSNGEPVRASDFEHTIKRVLNMESPGASYYEVIEGASAYLSRGDAEADIPGVETNDETGEVTIRLTAPEPTFSNVLAMNFAGLVPGDTPFENMTKDPPPGIGPYMLTKSIPNREYVMAQNPRFDAAQLDGIPAGEVRTITTKIVPSLAQETQEVISNQLDFMQGAPASDLKAEVIERFGPGGSDEQRYKEFDTLSTYFFFLNERTEPFEDPKVREAVNVGVDKPGLARLFAGGLTPGCSFLPPGMPGYTEEINISECPWGDPNESPDLERARRLIREAGAEGAQVTVWGYSDEPAKKVTEAYADELNRIGFEAKPKVISGAVYFQTVGNQKTEAQTGVANWFADFPHPLTFFPLLDGDSIQPTNNQNLSNADDPRINRELDALSREADLASVTDRWEALNDHAVEAAHLVPFGHTKLSTFVSDRIDFENCTLVHPLYATDYSSFCLK